MADQAFTPFLSDALVILGAAGIVIPVFARFRITPVIGFILVGVLAGPHGLGALVPQHPWLYYVTITDPEGLDLFAEFGIVLLLFSVGLELSFGRLWAMRRDVFGLGSLELLVGAALIGAGLAALGNSATTAIALGLALALSSTALVLRIVDPRTPVGRAALAMLLFEDIALVPIVFLLGAMARGGEAQTSADILRTLWQGGLTVALLMLLGRLALPLLFAQAARTKSPELFLAASLLVVIAAALATGAAGLSPIVGALVAGLLIAETEYHTEVEEITAPFKGLALGVFLITVGMSLDLGADLGPARRNRAGGGAGAGPQGGGDRPAAAGHGRAAGHRDRGGDPDVQPVRNHADRADRSGRRAADRPGVRAVLADRHRHRADRHAAAGAGGQTAGQADRSRRAAASTGAGGRPARHRHRLRAGRPAGLRHAARTWQGLHRHRFRPRSDPHWARAKAMPWRSATRRAAACSTISGSRGRAR